MDVIVSRDGFKALPDSSTVASGQDSGIVPFSMEKDDKCMGSSSFESGSIFWLSNKFLKNVGIFLLTKHKPIMSFSVDVVEVFWDT